MGCVSSVVVIADVKQRLVRITEQLSRQIGQDRGQLLALLEAGSHQEEEQEEEVEGAAAAAAARPPPAAAHVPASAPAADRKVRLFSLLAH